MPPTSRVRHPTVHVHPQPPGYQCPFCKLLDGYADDYASQHDIVYQNEFATAAVAPKWWGRNPGSVLVVPNTHAENKYDIADTDSAEVYKVVKKVVLAMRKTYGCGGISTRQHNEPSGNQDVWHFHVHIFPRYENDNLYQNHNDTHFADAAARAPYAAKLRQELEYPNVDDI